MNKILLVFIVVPVLCFAQNVGINTTTPKTDLHVNGNMQITGELSFGGDEKTPGITGKKDQVLFGMM